MPSNTRLYRQIYQKLSKMILDGDYEPGSRLPTERELSELFSVSRPTIREAMIALEATDQVTIKVGSGVFVKDSPSNRVEPDTKISPFEVIEARVLVEGEAAALAAKMISSTEKHHLHSAFKRLEKAGIDNSPASSEADRNFHTVIARATQNRVLQDQIYALWELQENLDHIKSAHTMICNKQGAKRISEHKAILDAIVDHQPEQARTAMHQHFSNVLEAMHAALEAEAIQAARLKGKKMRQRFSIDLRSSQYTSSS